MSEENEPAPIALIRCLVAGGWVESSQRHAGFQTVTGDVGTRDLEALDSNANYLKALCAFPKLRCGYALLH